MDTELAAMNDLLGLECIIHGACSGADALAGEWARANGVEEIAHPARWRGQFGRETIVGSPWAVRDEGQTIFRPMPAPTRTRLRRPAHSPFVDPAPGKLRVQVSGYHVRPVLSTKTPHDRFEAWTYET